MKKLFVIISLFANFIFLSFATNCGGVVECNCGDTVVDYYELQENLICDESGLIIKTNQFSCNGNSIIGSGVGFGLLIQGQNYVEISDCNIENFENGIEIKSDSVLKGNGWGAFWYEEVRSQNIEIFNNTLRNNLIGIKTKNSRFDNFYNNIFYNNSNGIYLDGSYSTLYNNSFFNSKIIYRNTKDKYFCKNGFGNNYFGFDGPECECLVPLDNLNVDSRVNFCDGYFNVSDIKMFDNSEIFCRGTIFNGDGDNNAILINGRKNTKIDSCSFENYSTSIKVQTRRELEYSTYVNYPSFNNKIENSNFQKVNIGIDFSDNNQGLVYNSTFKYTDLTPINLQGRSALIYGNNFYEKSPSFTSTNGKNFCYNGVENNYFDGAEFLGCGCFIPFDGLILNSNVNLCQGRYKLNSSLLIQANNININCDNTHLIGDGKSSAFTILGRSGNKINNCIISNYSKGIDIVSNYRRESGQYNSLRYPSRNNILNNLTIFDVNVGVNMEYKPNTNFYGRAEIINDSLIFADELVISNYGPFMILVNNSYFGLDDLNYIDELFYNYNYINLQNYKFENKYQYLIFDFNFSSNLLTVKKTNKNKLGNNFNIDVFYKKDGIILSEDRLFVKDDFFIKKDIKLNTFNLSFDKIYLKIDSLENLTKKNIYFKKYYEFEDNFAENKFINLSILNNFRNNFIFDNFYLLNDFEKNLLEERINIFLLKELNCLENSNLICENLSNIIINLSIDRSDNFFSLPYEVLIESFFIEDKRIINIKSNSIYGVVNGIFHYKNNLNFFNMNSISKTYGIKDYSGLKIYDFLFQKNNPYLFNEFNFQIFISNLNDLFNNDIFNKTEFFLNINLEIDNLNIDSIDYKLWKYENKYSSNLNSYLNKRENPIVLAGGLFSDITTWESLAKKLSEDGYIVYLIELTGGRSSDCINCYNYEYDFLVDFVLPEYIEFILDDSNKSQINFVGHSNGARVALDFLSKYQQSEFDYNYINTFIAVGVPGAFEGSSFLYKSIKKSAPILNKTLENKNHINIYDLVSLGFNKIPTRSSMISMNLWNTYLNWMLDEEKIQPGSNIYLNNFKLISGNFLFSGNDGIVTLEDQFGIFENVEKGVLNNSEHIITNHPHLMMSSFSRIQREVINFLNENG